jgi:hypothetical protein
VATNKQLNFAQILLPFFLFFHFLHIQRRLDLFCRTFEIVSWDEKHRGKYFPDCWCGGARASHTPRIQIVNLSSCSTSTTSSDMHRSKTTGSFGHFCFQKNKIKYLFPVTGCSLGLRSRLLIHSSPPKLVFLLSLMPTMIAASPVRNLACSSRLSSCSDFTSGNSWRPIEAAKLHRTYSVSSIRISCAATKPAKTPGNSLDFFG